MNDRQGLRAPALATVYFGYFAALGVFGPFVALYLEHRGLSPDRIAFLLALLPFFRVVSIPAWTAFADRLRSASAVLRLVAVGSLVVFAAFETRPSGLALVLVMVAFTTLRAPATSLMDVLALQWAARTGGSFGQMRAWGTIGFTVATFGAGVLIQARGPEVIVHASLVLLAVTAIATLRLPRGAAPERVRLLPALGVLVRRRRFLLFLATVSLHQLGLGAYDALFPAYLTHLSTATTAGLAIAVGAAAEVLFMTRARGLLTTLGLPRTLALAYAVSALRWLLVAVVRAPWVLVVIQLSHAFTFGAFYLAAVALVDEESPREVRASAQGIFAAVAWGLAGAAGLALAGWLQGHGGLPRVFQVASAFSVVSMLIALGMHRPAVRE
ncbi:MAG: MFS transporter [Deltaproteobacteria bacterium]